jgi:riboflavin kinase/FMN adenylyltransferase
LGFPTANLEPDSQEKLIPASGAYAVWAITDGYRMPAMMNIGTRPTFEGKQQTLEVHILKDVGDLYGKSITVEFVSRLRAEQRFDTREALIAQLERDRQATEDILLNDK